MNEWKLPKCIQYTHVRNELWGWNNNTLTHWATCFALLKRLNSIRMRLDSLCERYSAGHFAREISIASYEANLYALFKSFTVHFTAPLAAIATGYQSIDYNRAVCSSKLRISLRRLRILRAVWSILSRSLESKDQGRHTAVNRHIKLKKYSVDRT